MCGLAGLVTAHDVELSSERVQRMMLKIRSRGPDSQGLWNEQGVYLGHNRLAIHDLSLDGHQPMQSECGDYVLVFNGEIYNFQQLKKQLQSYQCTYKSNSDTEVLLACLQHFGVNKTLMLVDGMFAFAYWSRNDNKLVIARDRIGEKPLYYRFAHGEFVFASELKAVVAGCLDRLKINDHAVNSFLKYGYIPGEQSIYSGVHKLLPGHKLSIDLHFPIKEPVIEPYFSFVNDYHQNYETDENPHVLEKLLIQSVDLRLSADVTVGAFLSGGIDSSLICAIAKQALGKNISAHTIGFMEPEFDESQYASDVAQYLGCEHHIHMLTQEEMLKIIPKMAETYSEPFADASQLPTYLLCQKTRQEAIVALSGDAGDELFGGYSRYHIVLKRWENIVKQPLLLRKMMRLISDASMHWLNHCNVLIDEKEKLRRALRYWSNDSLNSFYQDSISYDWQTEQQDNVRLSEDISLSEDITSLMKTDALQYLPDCILTKVDRASMAHSLEVRVPLLSNDIVDYSRTLAPEALMNKGKGKWPLRSLLYKYIPENIVERPKKGFAVPLKYWLAEQLRPWGESLLSDKSLQEELPYVDHRKYQQYWHQHLKQQFDWSGQLWNYFQLLNWLKTVDKGH